MGKRSFLFKLLGHRRIVQNVPIVQRFPIIDTLFYLIYPIFLLYVQLSTTGCDMGSIAYAQRDRGLASLESGNDPHQ